MTLENDTSDIQAGEIGGDVIDALSSLPASVLGEFDDRGQPKETADEDEERREQPKKKGQSAADETEEGEDEPDLEEDGQKEDDDTEEQSKEDEDEADKAAASDEDYVEIPSEEGGEPTRIPVSDLLESHKRMQSFDGDIAAAKSQIETAFQQKMGPVLEAQIKARDDYIARYRKIREWTPVGDPPDPEVYLNPRSEDYDPQQWELKKAEHERRKAVWEKADAEIQEEQKKLEADRQAMAEETHKRERAALLHEWPELESEKGGELWAGLYLDVQKTYGLSADELNQVTDHRAFLMARDAIAYRKMKADKGKAVVKKGQAKLVKSKTRPSAQAKAGADRTRLKDTLRKTGSIETASELIKGLL